MRFNRSKRNCFKYLALGSLLVLSYCFLKACLSSTRRTGSEIVYCDSFNVEEGDEPVCGKPFEAKWKPFLEYFNLTDAQTAQMNKYDDRRILTKDPVFVTAFSDNHFNHARRLVLESFSVVHPKRKIIVYDLGLSEIHLKELREISFVSEIRTFDFSLYPNYVGDHFQFRFKPLLMAELLREFEAVFYADAHIVWLKEGNLDNLLKKVRCASSDCNHYNSVLFAEMGHSIYATTDERLLEFLPMNSIMTKKVRMPSAAFQLVYYTKDVRMNIFKWVVLCALEEDCMGPPGTTRNCEFGENLMTEYAHCHRYDQSAFSILLANRNRYNPKRYVIRFPFYHDN